MNRQERNEMRKRLEEKYEGIALMNSRYVEKEYEKVLSFEDKTFGGILEFLEKFDVFSSGLKFLIFDSGVDSNGYFTTMRISFTYDGEAIVSIFEGGCVRLNGQWIKHPDKYQDILKEKTFDSNEELRFILNSEMIKRKVGINTSLPNVSFFTDDLFDDDLEVKFRNK